MFSLILIPLGALLCLLPFVSSAMALLVGAAIALILGNPYLEKTRRLTTYLMQASIIGLGAGMNLEVVASVGLKGIGATLIAICVTITAGLLLGRLLKTQDEVSTLVTVGTAICGGSAIAAVAPVIHAKNHEVSVALGVVFVLNAVALFIFPTLGHWFDLSNLQFGTWCALAIHDTSSVVGAAMQFGPEAVDIATTLKLSRALWIVPIALFFGWKKHRSSKNDEHHDPKIKIKIPWFILGFLVAAAIVTYIPALKSAGEVINAAAKRTMVVTLFLIGAGLTVHNLKQVGLKPLVQGVLLWLSVAGGTLAAIKLGWI